MTIRKILCVICALNQVTAGTISYEQNDSLLLSSNVLIELRDISDGNVLLSDETDQDGFFDLSPSDATTYDVYLVAKNELVETGTSNDNRVEPITVYDQYESYEGQMLGSEIGDFTVSDNAVAFWFVDKYMDMVNYHETINFEPNYEIMRLSYPATETSFSKADRAINILEEHAFDDYVLYHEFAHHIAYEKNIDYGKGQAHTATGQYDLRFSFSEGFATYFSAYIRNDAVVYDELDLDSLGSSYLYSTNEFSLASVLWKTGEAYGHDDVLAACYEIENRTNEFYEEGTLDMFYDIWTELHPNDSIDAFLADRNIFYSEDIASSNIEADPYIIADVDTTVLNNLSWFPSDDEDWFELQLEGGETYTVAATNVQNGGLPKITLYEGGIVVESKEIDDEEENDVTSTITITPSSNTTYVLKTERYNSLDKNVGLGVDVSFGYEQTAGFYGSYDLSVTSSKATEETASSPSTSSSSGGGGGGGCLLR